MSLSQLQSTLGYITITADNNVNISDAHGVVFNEFNQATITINYIPQISRAKTAFVIRNASGSISQISYRGDVVKSSGETSSSSDTRVLFTGGLATMHIQSNVGRTSNISRGIIGATKRRNIGPFDFTIELWTSGTPNSTPNVKVDSLRVIGTINSAFPDETRVVVSDGESSLQKNYTISLPDSELSSLPYLYGYKFTSIPSYLTITKELTRIRQGDIIQSSSGSINVSSSGNNGSSFITFSVCSVDIDKMARDDTNIVTAYDFGALPTQNQPFTSSGDDVSVATADTSKIVVTYPRVSENVRGFLYYDDNKALVASDGTGNPKLSIWSDSARTRNDGFTTEGIMQIAFPTLIPVGESVVSWTFSSDTPLVQVYAKPGAYDPTAAKGEFVSQNNDGILQGTTTITNTNPIVTFDIKSLQFVYGNFQFTFKLSHGGNAAPVAVASLPSLNFRLLENDPLPMARDKRVYLYDNTLSFTMNPNLNDANSWQVGTNGAPNSLDNTVDGINTRFVDGQLMTRTFNMMYNDDNKESVHNFVGDNGNLGLFVDLSTVVTSVYGEDNPVSTENLVFLVNPTTFNTLRLEERTKNIWKNNVMGGYALNGSGTAKYQLYTLSDGSYTVTEYTRYFAADGTRAQVTINGDTSDKPDDSVVLASGLESLVDYPLATASAPTANLFLVPNISNGYSFVLTHTESVNNYYGVKYDILDNYIIMNPHPQDDENSNFYGRVTMSYKISDGTASSFDTATSNIYFMPKAKPVLSIQRCSLNNDGTLTELPEKFSFLFGETSVEYKVTTTIGNDGDFDYIDGTYGDDIPYETNDNIKHFLRTKHEVRINYSQAIPHESFNLLVKSQQISAGSMIFNPALSTFAGTSDAIAARNARIIRTADTAIKSHFGYQLNNNNLYVANPVSLALFQSTLSAAITAAITDAATDGIQMSQQDLSDLAISVTSSPDVWSGDEPLFSKGNTDAVITAYNNFIAEVSHNDTNADTNADIAEALIGLFSPIGIRNQVLTSITMATSSYPYNVNGYDILNWKIGTSQAVFDFVPNLGVGKYSTNVEVVYTAGAGTVSSKETQYVNTDIWSTQDVEIFGVPIIKGIRTSEDISLIGRDDFKTCTTAVVFNDGTENIDVAIMDIALTNPGIYNSGIYGETIYGSDSIYGSNSIYGDHSIYVNTLENLHVTIAPGNVRVFLRVMFEPDAWEGMPEDFIQPA